MNDCELFTWVKRHRDRSSRSIHTISVNDATRKFIRNKICKLSYFILNGSCVSCVCIVVVLVSASVAVCLPFALLYLPRKICWITILNYSRLSAGARSMATKWKRTGISQINVYTRKSNAIQMFGIQIQIYTHILRAFFFSFPFHHSFYFFLQFFRLFLTSIHWHYILFIGFLFLPINNRHIFPRKK